MMRFCLTVLVCVALLAAGCSLRPESPEAHAELFIDKLILVPHETETLADLATLPAMGGAESLVEGVAARAGLAYLQARARLGARIRVNASDHHARGDYQTVSVSAREGYTGGDAVRFRVYLREHESGWRVTRVTVD